MSHAMQKRRRIIRLGSLIAVATFAISAGFAQADDTAPAKAEASPSPAAKTRQTADPSKQTAAVNLAKSDDKSVKQDTASASKADLFTPASKLNFYGEAEVGAYASTLKCANKTQHTSGIYSDLMLGTDIKLTNNLTMGIQVQAGRGLDNFH